MLEAGHDSSAPPAQSECAASYGVFDHDNVLLI